MANQPSGPNEHPELPKGGLLPTPHPPVNPAAPSPLRARSPKPRSHSRRMRSAAASPANASCRQGDGNTWADMPASEGLKDYCQQHKHGWRGCHARLRGTDSCGGRNPPENPWDFIRGMHLNAGDPLPSSTLLTSQPQGCKTLKLKAPGACICRGIWLGGGGEERPEAALSCKVSEEDARRIHSGPQTFQCFSQLYRSRLGQQDADANECCISKVSTLVLFSWPTIKPPSSLAPPGGKANLWRPLAEPRALIQLLTLQPGQVLPLSTALHHTHSHHGQLWVLQPLPSAGTPSWD